ncbi:DUF1810 domain-containing protein [Azospirillum sp. 11R-A]|uniref:DUF1810 domain-containing protein n=1 Tax=Azospirillum sp. 11R-A TaxID=3111634 RepID=UPI003C23FE05
MPDSDPFDLQRFVEAQDPVYATVLAELRDGRKRSHWMWFIFPQLRDLGRSPTARFYGIAGLDEARAYLAHPVLGSRLAQATETVLAVQGRTLHEIFGSPDDLKFRSSMTLFAQAAAEEGDLYRKALDRFCDGQPDDATSRLLA